MTSGRMVETSATALRLDGYGLVLSHATVPVRSYCMEWSAEMLKESALLTLEICQKGLEHGAILQDAYPWNVLWNGTTPVFVDVGSLRPVEEEGQFIWSAYQQFCNFFLFPLYLYAAGLHEVVRPLLQDYLRGISFATCSALLSGGYKLTHPQTWTRLELPRRVSSLAQKLELDKKMQKTTHPPERLAAMRSGFFKGLVRDVSKIRLPKPTTTWVNYYEDWPSWDDSSNWHQKHRALADLLDEHRPNTVVDLACNEGWYAMLAAHRGSRVVAIDFDEGCVTRLYDRASQQRLDVLPLVMNLLNPTPAFGWKLVQFPSALARIQGEMVFALALIHHLVLTNWQSFERVVELLECFTTRWLVLEFVPLDDEKSQVLLSHFQRESFDWYTLENLQSVVSRYFSAQRLLESHPAGRTLILCEK